jgi:hypothetical protein
VGARLLVAGVLAAVIAAAPPAEAGGKRASGGGRVKVVKKATAGRAWEPLVPLLGADTEFLVGVDVQALHASPAYRLVEELVAQVAGTDDVRRTLRDTCKLTPIDSLDSVAIARAGGRALLAVKWRGVGEAELTRCAEKVAAASKPGAVVDARRDGKVSTWTLDGESLSAAWLASDVLLVVDRGDREALDAVLAGQGGFGGGASAKAAMAATSTGAAVWGVVLKRGSLDGQHDHEWLAGRLDIGGGKTTFTLVVGTGAASKAATAASDWKALRDQALAGGAGSQPLVASTLKAVQIVADGVTVRLSLSVDDGDLSAFLTLLGA